MSRPSVPSPLRRMRCLVDRLETRRLLCWGAIDPVLHNYRPEPDFTAYTPLPGNPTVGRVDAGRASGDGAGADIVWVNRLFNDNFALYYGTNEVLARSIVDRAIGDWERVIQDFNYAGGVQFSLTLRAEPGFPGSTVITDVENNTGKPKAATVLLDDNVVSAGGWYFDPTPGTSMLPDDAEFEDFIAPGRGDDGPVNSLDFYMVALHEIGHGLGVGSTDSDPNNNVPLAVNNFIPANTWIVDPVNPGDGVLPPNTPNRVDPGDALAPVNLGGGPIEFALTTAGSGGYPNLFPAHLYEGPAVAGYPGYPNDLMNDGRTASGNVDIRQLIGDAGVNFLSSVYGYTVTLPSQINTFHANFNTATGTLTVNGDPSNASFVTLDVVGADIRVQVDGTSELIPVALVDNIIIRTGDGPDTISINEVPAGIPSVQVLSGAGSDTLNVGSGDVDSTVLSRIQWLNAFTGTDALRLFDQSDTGNDSYFISNDEVTKPGTAFGGVGYSFDLESIVVTGNDSPNFFTVESLTTGDALTLNGRGGNDTIRVGSDFGLGEAVLGDVNANGDLGDDLVLFDDAAGTGDDLYLVNAGLFQQTGSQLLSFAAERLELRGNGGNNDIGVLATGATTLNLLGNNGDDDFILAAGDVDVQLTSNITVSGGVGVDRVNLNDVSAALGTTLVVDSDGTGDFVDLSSTDRVRAFSISEIILTGSPLADTFTTLAMQGAVRLSGNGGNDTMNVLGHPTFNSAILPRVTVASGAGADTLAVNADDAGGAPVVIEADESLARLEIGMGGNVRVGPGDRLLEVTASFLMPVSGAVLDLTDGSLVRRGNISVPFYRDRLASGYAAGAWNGPGIQSSTAASSVTSDGVGFSRGDGLFAGAAGVVDGIAMAPGDMLIRYTLNGDADLNRIVDFDDLLRVAQNYNFSPRDWWQGNFGYADNVVDFDDLLLVAQNYGLSLLADAGMDTKRPGRARGALDTIL